MNTIDIVNAIRDITEQFFTEYLEQLESDSRMLKGIRKRIVFCQDCKFSRVDRSRVCGYYCGHPKHIINMECNSFDFCSYGIRK